MFRCRSNLRSRFGRGRCRTRRWRAVLTLAAAALANAGCSAPEPPLMARAPVERDAFAHPSGALQWPGTTRAFLVDSTGALSNGLWRMRIVAASGAGPGRLVTPISAEDRWLPILSWSRRSGSVRWDLQAVPFPARAPGDSVLGVSLRIVATNDGAQTAEAHFAARLDPIPDGYPFVAADGDCPPGIAHDWCGVAGRDSACAWSSRRAGPGGVDQRWALRPGERRDVRLVISSHRLRVRELAAMARTAHERRARATRAYWREAAASGASFHLGDPEAERALLAARVILLSCRERRGGVWYPIGGPFHYRDVWLRDGARLAAALELLGYQEEAREVIGGLLTLQWPNGCFLSQRGQLDGTGEVLWAMDQVVSRGGRAPDARAIEAGLRAWRWVEDQRAMGAAAGWRFGRMMAFADPHDNELVRAQLVGNDAWTMAGYRALERLCAAAGRPQDSAAVARDLGGYQRDFRAALAASGWSDVRASWQGVGRDWGNLAVGWPTLALDARDPRLARMAARVWRASGGPGLVAYGDPDSLHGYLGADLGVWALLADRGAAAESVWAATLRWRTASGGGAEVFSRSKRDFGANLPPHPTTAAALVVLARCSLVYDDGDTLLLTLGPRASWWRHARVERLPTRWGLLDLDLRADADTVRWTWSPMPVWTCLRAPAGFEIRRLEGGGSRLEPDRRHVLAPPGTGAVSALLQPIGVTR